MTLFYPVENRKRKQKTIDVVRTSPPQILIHNKSRLAYLDNSQDHFSLPRIKLGLITLFRDASSPTPIVNNHIYITWKISKQLYLKSIRSHLPHSRDCIPLQLNSFWVLWVSSSFRNDEVEMSTANTVILLHQHLDWRLKVHIQNNKPLVYQRSVIVPRWQSMESLWSIIFNFFSAAGKKPTRTISLDFKL